MENIETVMYMNEEVEYIRHRIKENGYLSATKITLYLLKYNAKIKDEDIKQVLSDVVNNEIRKIEYTNRFVAPYTTKWLYLYSPKRASKRKTIKKVKKIAKKSKTSS